jgi:hypothetical protein
MSAVLVAKGSAFMMRSVLPPVAKGLPFSPSHVAATSSYWAWLRGALLEGPFASSRTRLPEIVVCVTLSCLVAVWPESWLDSTNGWGSSRSPFNFWIQPQWTPTVLVQQRPRCRPTVDDPPRGIPDTLSVLAAGLNDTGMCGLYGTGGGSERGWRCSARRPWAEGRS